MMTKRHIVRNYDANQTNRIRYDYDDFRLQLYCFDKSQERIWSSYDVSKFKHSSKVKEGSLGGMKTLHTSSDTMTLKFEFTPSKEGHYRLEFVYFNNRNSDGNKTSGTVYLNNTKLTKTDKWKGNAIVHNKHYSYFVVDKKQINKKQTIKYVVNKYCEFVALGLKQYDILQADRHNDDGFELTLKKASLDDANDVEVDTATFEIMYWHGLDDPSNINLSGYRIDYRDEINFYIKNNKGVETQVFGGYVSTVKVDEDLTTMTLECVNRLQDLDNRLMVTEIGLNSSEDTDMYDGFYDAFKNYDSFDDCYKFLMNYTELPFKNIVPSDNEKLNKRELVIDYTKDSKYTKSGYSSANKKNKLVYNNMILKQDEGFLSLRNSFMTEKPTNKMKYFITIFDDELMNLKNKISLNSDYPHFYIDYGFGEEAYEITKSTDSKSGVVTTTGGKIDVTSDLGKIAKNITDAEGWAAVKSIFKWWKANMSYSYYEDFKHGVKSTLSRGSANCCDSSRAFMTLCSKRGFPKDRMHYVHVKSGSKGHVFCKFKTDDGDWFIIDPVTSKGWGDYSRGYGTLPPVHETTFPKLPF